MAARLFVIGFSLITILCFASSIANYFEILRTECILEACGELGPPPTTVETLHRYNLTPESYAGALVMIDSALAFIFYTAAGIIFWKCKREMMGYLAILALVSYGSTFPALVYLASEGNWLLARWNDAAQAVGWMALFLFFLLFPNGRFSPRLTYVLFIPFCIIQLSGFMFPDTMLNLHHWSGSARIIVYAAAIGLMIYSQFYRYRKISASEQRQQTKWVVYGVSISFIGFIGVSAIFVYPAFAETPVTYLYLNGALHLFVAIIPFALTFAVLRHRLWDIDPLVNRTLVYGALSLAIVLIYSISVLYLSRLFRTEGNFFISLAATSVVAVLFVPIKERLQRVVNRMLKGRHDDPYSVLVELGDQLVKPIDPEAMLSVVASSIQDALRLPYAGISIRLNGQESLAAEVGKHKFEIHQFPIVHGGEELGMLLLSSRSAGEAFSAEDQKLLHVLLRQAGPIVHNVNMTFGNKLLAKDLQESRERLVLAREEERRQIRRNLHDDLAPRLMSLAFNVAAAEQYIKKSPDTAIELLEALRKTIRTTVDDIRTMVHDMRPPALDEFGLLGSVYARLDEVLKTSEQMSASTKSAPLQVSLHAPDELPALPAAVEVAAYRIITESLVNVVRHAQATYCEVHIQVHSSTELLIEVIDNGIGLPNQIKPSGNGGIGITSIRDRAAELGGQCIIERLESGGTRVKARLPFSQEAATI
ncbi:sensor histidine kinase [Paenibacillus sedimenti]|uniref:histidine kinase n=1 Tax=Paenibacillus sedimenti TaxID=2770274 RepID=A0A926KL57_9BACL|nr:histidine kinase [Paenibacillus sedimenti]MBD0379006.1 sensor histidine kinase [Paenibacillus sedimenti]